MKKECLSIYMVDEKYTDYLRSKEGKVANEKKNRTARKYIGILLKIDNLLYLAPLSSKKVKHVKIENAIDLVKVGDMAVVNLNNMIPVKRSVIKRVRFNDVSDIRYRRLLQKEYKEINLQRNKIESKARRLYKMMNKPVGEMNTYELSVKERCINFKRLEVFAKYY